MRLQFYGPIPDSLRDVTAATIYAGHKADRSVRERDHLASLDYKLGADITTKADRESEDDMHATIKIHDFEGGHAGEEIGEGNLLVDSENELLDGLDGSESATFSPGGRDDIYGPSAGIFRLHNEVLVPLRGATYLPRQHRGVAGSTEEGIAIEFEVSRTPEETIIRCYRLPEFDPDRTDIHYQMSWWPAPEEPGVPKWLTNMMEHVPKLGREGQFIPRMSGSCVGMLSALVETYSDPEKRTSEGPSAAISPYDIRFHDFMGVAPAILALGGTIQSLEGISLLDPEFVKPYTFPDGTRIKGARDLIEKRKLTAYPAGPVIFAQNEYVAETVRRIMRKK